jgi:hypothetical protein
MVSMPLSANHVAVVLLNAWPVYEAVSDSRRNIAIVEGYSPSVFLPNG